MSDSSQPPSGQLHSGYIDAHVHLWTSDTQRYPLAPGYSPEQMQPPCFTAEDFFAHARPLGIERTVLIQMSFYGHSNSYMLDAIKTYPAVFAGVAQIDERGHDPAAQLRRLKALGIRGVRISPFKSSDTSWLDGSEMQVIWRCGAEEQLAICPLIDPEHLPAIDRMCERFPDTPVVVDHCARIGGDGQIRESDLAQLGCLARHPRTHVKLSAFYYLGEKRPPYVDLVPMLRRLCDTFGPKRLMWASDSPFQVQPPHTYEDSLALVRDHLDFLSDADRMWILRGAAENVFFNQ